MGAVFAMLLSVETDVAHVVSLGAPIMIAPEQGIEHLPTREACVDRYVPKARRRLQNVPCGANNTYRRMPLVSIHEMMDVIAILCGQIAKVTAPILIVHGERDHTADPKSADYLYENVRSPRCEKYILPDAGHLLPLDLGIRERVFARTASFLLDESE